MLLLSVMIVKLAYREHINVSAILGVDPEQLRDEIPKYRKKARRGPPFKLADQTEKHCNEDIWEKCLREKYGEPQTVMNRQEHKNKMSKLVVTLYRMMVFVVVIKLKNLHNLIN